MLEIKDYIANQIDGNGLDELQKLSICYYLKQNVALDGKPGVGKTESVFAFSQIIEKEVYDKGCSEETTENQIIGFPVLEEKNGATTTKYVDGPLTLAMRTGNIFYGDEFNLLRKDKQKRLNSAFDNRRYIIKSDNEKIVAKNDYFAVITYNPSNSYVTKDFDDSVADRFIHFHYKPLDQELTKYISLKKINNNYENENIKLEKRGILFLKNKLIFLIKIKSEWYDFFTKKFINGKIFNKIEPYLKVYDVYKPDYNKSLFYSSGRKYSPNQLENFADRLTKFTECIASLITSGTNNLSKEIVDNLPNKDFFSNLPAHYPSLRINIAVLKQYDLLMSMGMNEQKCISYASFLCIDYICNGNYRNLKVDNMSSYEIVKTIAEIFGLLNNTTIYSYNFAGSNSLKKGA